MSRLKIIDVPEDTQLYQDALTGFLFSMPEKTASDDISVISASKITDCHTYAIIDALKNRILPFYLMRMRRNGHAYGKVNWENSFLFMRLISSGWKKISHLRNG